MSSKGNGVNLLPFEYKVGSIVCAARIGIGLITDKTKDGEGNTEFTVLVVHSISDKQVYTHPFYINSKGFLEGVRRKGDGSNRFIPYDVYVTLLNNGILRHVGADTFSDVLDSLDFIHFNKDRLLKAKDTEKGWNWRGYPWDKRCGVPLETVHLDKRCKA